MQQHTLHIAGGVARNPLVRLSNPVTLDFLDGEHIAIVGPNGAGKSLLVDLLTGKYPLRDGVLTYDFRPSATQTAYDNIKYIAFRDTYGSADANYYYQQRWNAHDQEDAPLVRELLGVLPAYFPFTCYSLTGYSGGGKSMIAAYEAPDRPEGYSAPRSYGLTLKHKHLPEMTAVCGLTSAPLFCPIVDDFYSGMQTVVPLRLELVQDVPPEQVAACLADYYQGESQVLVHPLNELPEDKFLTTNLRTGSDKMEIFVVGHESQLLVMSLFDNLGKGSSGAAVQCMNLMLGLPETEGLE